MEFAESNHTLLTNIQHELVESRKIAEQQLAIAIEYKKLIGDPLRHGLWFVRMLRNTLAVIVGTLLTGWGLMEIFSNFFAPKR